MNQNMAAAKDSSKLVALRRLSDAELASEIEKDGDPCLIGAMAQASAAKSATAEGEAGGKKL